MIANASGLAVYALTFDLNDPDDTDDDELVGYDVEKQVGHPAPSGCELAAQYLT